MVNYFLKKIFIFLTSLLFIVTFTFFIMKAIPGDPFLQEQEIPKETLIALHKYYGLDQPLYIQYLKYLKGFFTFDLGPSYVYQGRGVNQIIKEGFPFSLIIGLEALFLSIVLGITLGCIAALKKNGWQNGLAILIAILGISMPNYLLATLLQYLFSIKLSLFPVARFSSFAHSILPSISLAAMPIAFIARLTRSNMIEVLEQDYIKTAYAKGLNSFQVIIKHGLKNALLPIISYLGPMTTYILTGSFVIEKIFGIPGLGKWLIHSIYNRDYPLIIGLTLFCSFILMSLVFLSDIIIGFLDPRIKINAKRNII